MIVLDRVLTPSWVVRREWLGGVVQNEHLTRPLGRGTSAMRPRLKILLEGRDEVTVGDRTFELHAGDFLLVPCIAETLSNGGNHHLLELDWDMNAALAMGPVTSLEHGQLDGAPRAGAAAIANALSAAGAGARDALEAVMPNALRALASQGLPFDGGGAAHELEAAVDAEDQCLFDAIDGVLSNLEEGPAVVELEARLGWSSRTVSRRTKILHARYGLSGIDGDGWRTVRDFYRLIVGSIFASHPHVTTNGLASILGYASPDALCHAFANAGLASPGRMRKVT